MDTYQSTSEVPDQPAAAVGYAGVLSELLPIALWREDADGIIVEWSLAAQDLLGHRPEDIIGLPGSSVLVPDANRTLADDLTRRVQAGETVVGTLPVRHRDGQRVPMEMWIVPAADPQGRTGAMLIAVETSEVLRMRTRSRPSRACSPSRRSDSPPWAPTCASCASTTHSPG